LKSWVARIVINVALDHLRTQNRFHMVDIIPDEPDDDEEEPDISEMTPDVLTELIGQLPPNYRTVLNLFVFEQCPHKEIARQLGIKESTSSSIFFRAKKMLARMIKERQN